MKYIRLLRVKHYLKQLLIFLPIIFSMDLLNYSILKEVIIGVILFSLTSSMVYIFNDIHDIEKDRKHHTKQKRPLASGEISILSAWGLFFILAIIVSLILLYRKNLMEIVCLSVYLIINIGYTLGLKNVALMDVFILATGYLIRLFYGGILSGLKISDWMFLTVLSAAIFLAFGKRKNEMRSYGKETRIVLIKYTYEFLDKSTQLALGLTLVFYSLSCADEGTAVAKAGANFIWTVPIVFAIFIRYNMLLEDLECDGDPIEIVLKDKCIWILFVVYVLVILTLLYNS